MKDKTSEEKASLRRLLKKRRDALQGRQELDALIGERLLGLEAFREARRVALYASFRSEVDTWGLISLALGQGKEVALPVVKGRGLEFYTIRDASELKPGYRGIPEPPALPERHTEPSSMGLMVVPLLGFDERCYRLGYGGGYYDRLLGPLKGAVPLVGLAYEAQGLQEGLPREAHDVPLDVIITERRVITCG